MPKTVRADVDPFYFHYPAGATIVTSHAEGKDNAMAVAWHTAVSREPPYYVVSISRERFTHELVAKTGEFVVNFMPVEHANLVAMVAGCSGREVDKFHAFQISAQPGSSVDAPVLNDALAAYECRLVGRHTYGDHDLFIGEVVAVQWDAAAFTSDGWLDIERARPVVYLGEDGYATASDAVVMEREELVKSALDATS